MTLDLAASKSCILSLLDTNAPTTYEDHADLDAYVTHVVLPGSATVRIDGHEVYIPEGQQRWVRSTSMAYERVR